MSDWIPICALADIPRLGSRRVQRERGLAVAVFRTADDQVFALLDRCPHKGGPLSQGIVFGHRSPARCTTGASAWPMATPRRPTKAARPASPAGVQDGQVHLDAAELASKALDLPAPVAGPCDRACA